MRVKDLLRLLSDMPEDAEVLIATQPSWPLQSRLGNVKIMRVDERGREIDEEEFERGPDESYTEFEERCAEMEEMTHEVVYLVEGGQAEHPYAPRAVFGR